MLYKKGLFQEKYKRIFAKKYGPHLSARTVFYGNYSYLSFQNDISSIIPKWVIQIYSGFLFRLMAGKTVVLKWCRRPFDMITRCRIDMTDDRIFESDDALYEMKMTLFQRWGAGIFYPLLRLWRRVIFLSYKKDFAMKTRVISERKWPQKLLETLSFLKDRRFLKDILLRSVLKRLSSLRTN